MNGRYFSPQSSNLSFLSTNYVQVNCGLIDDTFPLLTQNCGSVQGQRSKLYRPVIEISLTLTAQSAVKLFRTKIEMPTTVKMFYMMQF